MSRANKVSLIKYKSGQYGIYIAGVVLKMGLVGQGVEHFS